MSMFLFETLFRPVNKSSIASRWVSNEVALPQFSLMPFADCGAIESLSFAQSSA